MDLIEEFDRWLERRVPLTDQERAEECLRYFSCVIECVDEPVLQALRERCAGTHDGTAAHETLLQVLDGELALRRMG